MPFTNLRKAPSEQSLLSAGSNPIGGTRIDRAPLINRFVADQQKRIQKQKQPQSSTIDQSNNNSRPTKSAFLKESLTRVLDRLDTRVAFLRETANELEDEKRKLLDALNSVETTDELTIIDEGSCHFFCTFTA